ncbi:hypothetical protein HY492_00080 [Candidatus Woesearchaeota archaeon]|nr:hypothetical protein [Candidatus Woesearchaeota archaeon]
MADLTNEQRNALEELTKLLDEHCAQRATTDAVRHAIKQCQRAGIPSVVIDEVLLSEMTKRMKR